MFGCETQQTHQQIAAIWREIRGGKKDERRKGRGVLWGASRYGQDYRARTWGSLPLTDALRTTITH